MEVLDGIKSEIRAADFTIAISTEFISPLRPDVPGFEAKRLEWFKAKYHGIKFDAIIVFGPQTLRALVPLRKELWPDVPVVFCAADSESYREASSQFELTGVLISHDLSRNLRIYRQILPDTKRLALVGGASASDRANNAVVPETMREIGSPFELLDLTGLPLEELKRRVAVLPDHTIILIFSYFYDPSGRPMFVSDLVSSLRLTANAPIFEINDFSMGSGNVGGALTRYAQYGGEAARIAVKILHGEKASQIPVTDPFYFSLQFDWRELQRWKIAMDRLPPGSAVLYRPFNAWERYRWWILGAVGAGLIESLLIAFLLYQRRRSREIELARKQAEEEARVVREEISHLNRIASMGELAASLAHELNQPLSGILANAQAASRFARRPAPELDEVCAALQDIESDGLRAGEVIRKMRKMLKKGEAQPAMLDLNAVAADAVALLANDARLRKITLLLEQAPALPPVRADAVQLQQVIINLVFNGMDAIADRHERRIIVRSAAGNGGPRISVSDSGRGIPTDMLDRIFDPFFSTKREGLGMGLSISRSIIHAHGGRIWAESHEGGGAAFHFLLPAVSAGGNAA
jgi:signal transduction histidine kinase